jgi:hypothetical protein
MIRRRFGRGRLYWGTEGVFPLPEPGLAGDQFDRIGKRNSLTKISLCDPEVLEHRDFAKIHEKCKGHCSR